MSKMMRYGVWIILVGALMAAMVISTDLWAAPGQSVERQTVPTRTPSSTATSPPPTKPPATSPPPTKPPATSPPPTKPPATSPPPTKPPATNPPPTAQMTPTPTPTVAVASPTPPPTSPAVETTLTSIIMAPEAAVTIVVDLTLTSVPAIPPGSPAPEDVLSFPSPTAAAQTESSGGGAQVPPISCAGVGLGMIFLVSLAVWTRRA